MGGFQNCRTFFLELSTSWVRSSRLLFPFSSFLALYPFFHLYFFKLFQDQITWTTWGSWLSSSRSRHLVQGLVQQQPKTMMMMRSPILLLGRPLKPQQKRVTLLERVFRGFCAITYISNWEFYPLFRLTKCFILCSPCDTILDSCMLLPEDFTIFQMPDLVLSSYLKSIFSDHPIPFTFMVLPLSEEFIFSLVLAWCLPDLKHIWYGSKQYIYAI